MPEPKCGLILNVDDNEAGRYSTTKILKKAGFDVIEAANGTDTLTLAADRHPDLVLLDVNLPDISGFEVCKQLKQDNRTASILVVHQSAMFVRSPDQVQGLEGGADGYLVHPIEPDVLVATLRSYLRIRSAEKALRESEERFRTILHSMHFGLVIIDAQTHTILDANEKALEMIGGGTGGIVGSVCHRFICPAESGRCPVTDLKQTVDFSERVLLTLRGEKIPILKSVTPTTLGGKKVLIESFIDISERKKAEAQLLLKNIVFQSSIAANSIANNQGIITDVNLAFLQLWGYRTAEEAIGNSVSSFFDREEDGAQVLEALNTLGRWEGEFLAKKTDGSTFITQGIATVIRDEKGEPIGYQSSNLDISDRKRAEEEIRHSSERLSLAILVGGIGIWELDLVTNTLVWDDQMFQLYGITKDRFSGTYEAWRAGVHPDDLVQGEAELGQAIRGEKEFDTEFRVVWPDTTVHYLRARARVHHDTAGKPVLIVGTNYDITNHRRAEEELKQISHYTRSLIEVNLDPLVTISPEGKITDVNEATIRATGVSRDTLIGSDFSAYFTEPDEAAAGYRKVLADGSVRDYPLTLRHTSGRTIDVLYNASVYRNAKGELQGVFAAARDITDRKRAEEALQESEHKFQTLADFTYDWAYWVGPDFSLIYTSPSCERVTGYAPEDFASTPDLALTIVHPDDRELYKKHRSEVHGGQGSGELEFRIIHRDGSIRWLGHVCSPIIDSAGNFIGTRVSNRDITDRKHAELELARSNRELQQFAYISSHDLQEPLRMISNFVQLLEKRYKGKLDKDADEFIGYVVEGTSRMERMIQDLLTLSRVQSRGAEFAPVDTNQVFEKTVFSHQIMISEAGAVVTKDDLPTVMGDETQLSQLFQNLIDNAIKFRRAEETPNVHISAQRKGNDWEFSVQDNGIGIDPQYFDRIFIIFQRLHSREAYEGTGIGLAICMRIVDRHGGRIWVESEPGRGSLFHFTLPAVKCERWYHEKRNQTSGNSSGRR